MKDELNQYPKYKQAYIHAFDRMLKAREDAGLNNYDWKNGEDVMKWWVGDDPSQISMDLAGLDDEM